MPERELPEHLKARLSDELTSGSPLTSPQPAQARYAHLATTVAMRHVRRRLLTAGAAAAALIVVGSVAAPSQAKRWIGDSVGNITHSVGGRERATPTPVAPSPQPAHETPAEPSESAEPTPSNEPRESPEPSESAEPRESPEPSASPRPSQSPEPSESPEPSGEGGE